MIETELNQKSNYDPSINPFLQSEELEKEFNKINSTPKTAEAKDFRKNLIKNLKVWI